MDKLNGLMENERILISIAIIVVGILLYLFVKKIMKKIIEINKNNDKINKKNRTYIRLFNSIFKYLIIILVFLLVLQVNGVNVTSIVAGLGLVSVIVGLALQDALKDIIMGINIIVDSYFSVGDVIKIGDIEGKVLQVGIKTTKMQDVNNGNLLAIANRNISQALTLSTQLDIDVPLPYEEPIDKIEEAIETIVNIISKLDSVRKVEYKGVNEFGDSAIYYKIRISCKPELKPQTKRDANRIIKLELDKRKIEIPYTQIDIHTK